VTDALTPKPWPKLVDVARLTNKERVARAAAAAAADIAARVSKLSDAPTFLLRLMARDHRERLSGLLDEAQSGSVDLCENASLLSTIASRLVEIEDELVSR